MQTSSGRVLQKLTAKGNEGLAVASIARDVVVEMTPPATKMRGKVGSEFET